MDQKVKAEWVEALGSGRYEKGKYMLRDLEDRYDATGVLCELAVAAGVIEPAKRYDKANAEVFFGYQYMDPATKSSYATGLPEAVQEWSGVSWSQGMKVAMMGDHGKSFGAIALWIENNL